MRPPSPGPPATARMNIPPFTGSTDHLESKPLASQLKYSSIPVPYAYEILQLGGGGGTRLDKPDGSHSIGKRRILLWIKLRIESTAQVLRLSVV